MPGCLYCSLCGAYSSKRTVKLHGPCTRKIPSAVVGKRLEKLSRGCHPISGVFLGLPRPLANPAEEFCVVLEGEACTGQGGVQP